MKSPRHTDSQVVGRLLLTIYNRLFATYGPQCWWPAEKPFEVMVGAILTQSTAWRNVEKAIANLKAAGALSPVALRRLSLSEIAVLIRPSGYYNTKARKLKTLAEWLEDSYGDDIAQMSAQGTERLRHQLLSVFGVGPETADSIILYAANQPVFVIDAYTRRIIDRLGLAPGQESYRAYQTLFMNNLPGDAKLFNEYHALLVQVGKKLCRKLPLCAQCCLSDLCPISQVDKYIEGV